jgi:thymidylate synthase ThyX
MKSELKDVYLEAINLLFDTYEKIEPLMLEFIKKKYPQGKEGSDLIYKSITKSRTCDNIRYLLPAATLTSLGMTANARVFARFLVKMLSHPLVEMQEIGEEAKARGLEEVPTLLKFLEANKYLQNSAVVIKQTADNKLAGQPLDDSQPVVLIDYDKNAINKIIAAMLYRESQVSYQQALAEVSKWDDKSKEEFLDSVNKDRAGFDQLLREFEHAYYTFDVLLDFGAFRDVQRHRMVTQTNQRVTVKHGYEIPNEVIELGFKDEYVVAMEKARAAFEKISQAFPEEAQYVVPLAFRKRVLLTWNLRELSHFIPLRSGPKGHQSYRRIAQKIWDELNKVQPLLARYISVDKSESTVSWASGMYKEEYNYDPNVARAKLKK